MDNITTVKLFNLCGLQETWMNKSVYFPLTLVTYLLIITVNLTLITTIIMEKSLHEPMYISICNLSTSALYGTVGFYPMFINELLSDIHEISYAACFTQMYVISSYEMCEITIISVMAFDRYVAICRPLHYHIFMSPLNVGILLLFAWLYPLFFVAVIITLTLRLPLCGSNISKVFCDNISILKHSCVPITLNRIWSNVGLTVHALLIISILYSYCQIIRICLNSAEGRIKFTQTCVPHLLVITLFIVAAMFDYLYGWFDNGSVPINARNAMAIQFLLIPPVLNPLIYGLNLKKIRILIFNKCGMKNVLTKLERLCTRWFNCQQTLLVVKLF